MTNSKQPEPFTKTLSHWVDIYGLCCHQRPCGYLYSLLSGSHVEVCGSCYGQRQYGCSWSVLLLGSVLMSVSCATARERLCGNLRSMLFQETMWKLILPATKGKEASFVVIWMTTKSQLRMRSVEGFFDNLTPCFTSPLSKKEKKKEKKCLNKKPLKSTLIKNCNRNTEV